MIIEIMPYQHLTADRSKKAGIQNQVFATKNGRGFTLHAILEFTAGTEYWNLVDLDFDFNNVELGRSFLLHGKRPKGEMSLVGIPVKSMTDVKTEIRYCQDRLRFSLSHQSEEVSRLEEPLGNVVSINDWRYRA